MKILFYFFAMSDQYVSTHRMSHLLDNLKLLGGKHKFLWCLRKARRQNSKEFPSQQTFLVEYRGART